MDHKVTANALFAFWMQCVHFDEFDCRPSYRPFSGYEPLKSRLSFCVRIENRLFYLSRIQRESSDPNGNPCEVKLILIFDLCCCVESAGWHCPPLINFSLCAHPIHSFIHSIHLNCASTLNRQLIAKSTKNIFFEISIQRRTASEERSGKCIYIKHDEPMRCWFIHSLNERTGNKYTQSQRTRKTICFILLDFYFLFFSSSFRFILWPHTGALAVVRMHAMNDDDNAVVSFCWR